MKFLTILTLLSSAFSSVLSSVATCPCSVFPACTQKASTELFTCASICRDKPFLDQQDCELSCNLNFQVVMQQPRTCPLKVCSDCDQCKLDCNSQLVVCKKNCEKNCLCSKAYDACMKSLEPCVILSSPPSPSPPPPSFPHIRDISLVDSLTQEALALSDGVFFSTAPHMLPYKGVTTIGKGEFLQSPSGLYTLQFLDNGDLGLFAGGVQLWYAYKVQNRGEPGHIEFDHEKGVLRMYSSTNELWWDSLTVIRNVRECRGMHYVKWCHMVPRVCHDPEPKGKGPYKLLLTDNGNVEIVDTLGKVFFESATSEQGLLIADINSKADYTTGVTTIENLTSFLETWTSVPLDVRIMFETSIYAALNEWKIFSMHFSPSQGVVEEWVGASKQNDGTVSLLYIHIVSAGKPIQQYTPIRVPSCHRCWFHSCCSTNTVDVPRGFHVDELTSMVISLRRAGFFALENIISNL